MKKNILAIIILAATLVNLTISAVMMFSVVPTTNKVNTLILKIIDKLDLEVTEPIKTDKENEVSVADMSHYAIEEEILVTLLKVEGDSKNHHAQIKASITLNSKAEDFKTVNELIPNNEAYIKELIQNIAGSYSHNEINEKKDEIRDKIVTALKEYFNTESIIGVTFSKFIAE